MSVTILQEYMEKVDSSFQVADANLCAFTEITIENVKWSGMFKSDKSAHGALMGVYQNDFITECCNKDNLQHGLFRQVYNNSLVFKLYKNDVKLALVQFDKNLQELKREDP